MGNVGMKIVKVGISKSVLDAALGNDEIGFNSAWPVFKVKAIGGGTLATARANVSGGQGAGNTTINVDSTAGFPGSNGVIAVSDMNPFFPTVEYIFYEGMTPTAFTVCTRGHWGSDAMDLDDGDDIYCALLKADIAHGLGYRPVCVAYYKPAAVSNYSFLPAVAGAFGVSGRYANIDATNLKIRLMTKYDLSNQFSLFVDMYYKYYIFYDAL